jgi:hypothetical protein
MPVLQKQTQAVESELYSLKMAAADETKYLRLAESLADSAVSCGCEPRCWTSQCGNRFCACW